MKRLSPYFLGLLLCACIITWQACQKDLKIELPGSPPSQQLLNTTIQGRVFNEKKEPVSAAIVQVNSTTTATTDKNGYFRFNNIQVNKNAGFVKVEKTAYFTGSRTIVVKKDAVNYVEIELIPKIISGTFSASTGGSVTVASGGTIDFSGNSVITSSTNTGYNGAVSVSAFFINPEAGNFASIMPGELRGITTANEERGLQSFGMMAIELSGSGGEKLQLATGKTATINFPIPASFQAQAPASIPLWYFNDATGLWKEQGSATRQGTKYTGTVSHFSFWNCDAPFPVVDFEAKFTDQNGNPVTETKVVIQKIKTSIYSYAYTDGNGIISGKIPANETLVMEVYNKCGNLLLSKTIGPFTSGINLGTISVSIAPGSSVNITGTATNCLGQPVTNGYVSISLDGLYYTTTISNGQFSILIVRCTNVPTSADMYASDISGKQQGPVSTLQINGANSNAGSLSACGTSTAQYLNYSLNNVQYSLDSPPDSLVAYYSGAPNNTMSISGSGAGRDVSFNFQASSQVPGTYPVSFLYITNGNKQYIKSGPINVKITAFGSFGQLLTGSLSGSVQDSTNVSITYPVSIDFKVRRVN